MLRFDGTHLFPLRRAYTASYKLSPAEAALYEAVTSYVRGEMNRADSLQDNTRKSSVGFALAALQRRLASSPEAIYQSLRRRHSKMQRRLEEERLRARGGMLQRQEESARVPDDLWDAEDQLQSEEFEALEEQLVDAASAAQTIQELEAELVVLAELEKQAMHLRNSNQDRKWDELSQLLQGSEMRDAEGSQRKLIIFTEHKETLHYLERQIRNLLGSEEAVVLIQRRCAPRRASESAGTFPQRQPCEGSAGH